MQQLPPSTVPHSKPGFARESLTASPENVRLEDEPNRSSAVIFETTGGGDSSSVVPGLPSAKQHVEAFRTAFNKEGIDDPFAQIYSTKLVEQLITPSTRFTFEQSHLVELGIRFGHREQFLNAIKKLRTTTRTTFVSLQNAIRLDDSIESLDDSINPKRVADFFDDSDSDREARGAAPVNAKVPDALRRTTRNLDSGATWHDWSGLAPGKTRRTARDRFFDKMTSVCNRFDCSDKKALMRLFANNKPLPFLISDIGVHGVLLRLPSPTLIAGEEGQQIEVTDLACTMHELMNRLVVIIGPDVRGRPTMVTYRKDTQVPWIASITSDWASLASHSLDDVLTRLLRDSMESFRPILQTLQRQLEAITAFPDSYKPKYVVNALSRIHRQASVMSRSLAGNAKALREMDDDATLAADLRVPINIADSLRELAEEISENAQEMMSLRLTMLEFVTQRNMKIFTYFSVVVSPIGVITGWFGMNFDQMDELHIDGFYYGVVAFAVAAMVLITGMLVRINRDRRITPEDEQIATVVLMEAAVDDHEM